MVAVLLCLSAVYLVSISSHKKELRQQIEDMPTFEVFRLNGMTFSRDSLQQDNYTIFIYFHTDCDFCKHEIADITKNIEKFGTVQIILITVDELETVRRYVSTEKLDSYPTITVLYDNRMDFATRFNIKSSPCTLIYNSKQKLVKRINGQTLAKNLIKEIN
jgi:peroxiredoxin